MLNETMDRMRDAEKFKRSNFENYFCNVIAVVADIIFRPYQYTAAEIVYYSKLYELILELMDKYRVTHYLFSEMKTVEELAAICKISLRTFYKRLDQIYQRFFMILDRFEQNHFPYVQGASATG